MPEASQGPLRCGFIPELNGLRAIAIILVFLSHVQGLIPSVNLPTAIAKSYISQGWMGVDLFFVLSGFLITGILLDTREAKNYFGGFYARRALRIFPLYYLVLTAVIVGGSLLHSPQVSSVLPLPADRWVYYCYLTNWLGLWKAHWGPGYANYLAHFWSLAVEEQFYFVWPLMVWLLPRRTIPWVAGGLTLLSVIIRLVWVSHSGAQIAIAIATITRMDALFVGAICAILFRSSQSMERVRKWLPWVAGSGLGTYLLGYSAMLFYPRWAAQFLYGPNPAKHTVEEASLLFAECGGFTLLALAFGALTLLAAYNTGKRSWMQRVLRTRPLGAIGTCSYGIYVYHVPLLGAALLFIAPAVSSGSGSMLSGLRFVTFLAAVTFIISALSYELFERKILGLKRYFEPKYSTSDAYCKEPTPANMR